MTKTRRPPGPPQRLFRGSLPEFRRNVLGYMRECAERYGDIVWFRLGPRECILINHPDLIETVLVKNHKNFIKHFAVRLARPVLGNGLLTSEGDFWRRQRRLAAPAFSAERIAEYGPDMVAATVRMLGGWHDGETHDIHADMMQLTLDIVAKTLFGTDVGDASQEVDRALHSALNSFASRINSTIPLPAWIPTPSNLRFHSAVRGLNQVVQRIVAERRRDGRERKDLLSLLLHARDEDDGGQMTDAQLADEARTFLLAGHETTALSLSWSWYLLAKHPEIQAKLQAELDRVLGDRLPQVFDLPKLKYAEQIILESMRLYPPAFVIGREPLADCELGGYTVRAGTTVFMSPWLMHRDARYHERPEQFEPERWAGEKAQALPKMAYFPFGGGPRICIGNTFAMMESVLLLATIARQWSFKLVPNHPIELVPLFTLRPKYGIQVVLSKRATPKGDSPEGALTQVVS